MNISIPAPPDITGDANTDIKALQDWSTALYMQLKRILYNLDSTNILSLDASLLNGSMNMGEATIEGNGIKIAEGDILISNSDGSQYLMLADDTLKFCGTVV